ncbi:hypothetical protein ABRP95_09760 [Corynebacterium sp. KPL2895]|uniref:hypothetical protein n=1 Tax=Corynebacterium sp. KPL2895 TaxID=3158320 RepID=UPI0032ED2F7D
MISETTLEDLRAVARGKRIHSQFKLKNLENHGLVTLIKRNSKLEVEALTTAGYAALDDTLGEPRR